MRQLTRQDVRQLAITKQHLHKHKPASMLDVIRDMGCVQLDPISAVERSHLLVLWSRLGQYAEADINALLWERKDVFEYWAHAASIVLMEDYPVHAWHMRQKAANPNHYQWLADRGAAPLIDYVRDYLRDHGANLSRDIEAGDVDPREENHAWYSSRYVPRVLSYLWTRGEVMVVGRQGKQRIWDLTERHLPEWAPREEWGDAQITHFAAQKAIKALGVGTPAHIKYHYTRGRYPNLPETLATLVNEQLLERVEVVENGEALKGDWYIHTDDVPLLEQLQAGQFAPRTTLLSPFDNLICDRDRTELLFDFFYRIEIYVPKAKRQYGYYVLPILHGDQLIGRIDPRMDRKTGTFHVQNVYAERGAPKNKRLVRQIQRSIEDLAQFLGAERIAWGHVPDAWTIKSGDHQQTCSRRNE
ncbi:MAG: crosslink repair DNA glycosylase YcaQ family protein [Chloroflexota bacterium]